MADSDYTNSPAMDPNFTAQTPASDMLAGALDSPQFKESAVLSRRNDTDAGGNELSRDLGSMDYYQLQRKYGDRVASRQGEIRQEMNRQDAIAKAEQSVGQIIGDSAIGAAASFVDVVGGGGSLVASGIGAVDRYFDPENTAISEFAVDYSQTTSDVSGFMRGFQSQELQNKQELGQSLGDLQSQDSQAKYENDIASGDNAFAAGLRQVGRDGLATTNRIANDPAVLRDVITSALGSLGPSIKVAGAAANLSQSIMTRIGGGSLKAQGRARMVGSAMGVGLVEANGAYSDTISKVMAMSHDDLLVNAPAYAEQIANGVDPETAQMILAVDSGQSAFLTQLPAATALGLLGGKLERGEFASAGLMGVLKGVGTQTLEEAGQGASATLASNYVIGRDVNPEQTLAAGVGEAAATGALAGAGMAGVLTTPGSTVNGIRSAASTISDALNTDTELGQSFRDKTRAVRSGAASMIDSSESVVGAVAGKVAPYVAPITDRVAPIVNAAATAVNENVITPVSETATAIADRADPVIRTANIVAGEAASAAAADLILDAPDTVTPSMKRVAQDVSTDPIPEGFSKSVLPGRTVIEDVTGILQSVTNKEVNIRKMDDAQLLYAAERVSTLRSETASLPAAVKAQVMAVLSSPDLARIETAAKKIDMNTTVTAETAVTPENTAQAIQVAKTNPTNVNPVHVKKILEQNNDEMTPENIKILQTAAEIATLVNNHSGDLVTVSSNRSIALSQKPAYKGKAPVVKTLESVSRSIQVGGMKGMRSINDFAADYLKGAQNENGTLVNEEGNTIKKEVVREQFLKFATHLNNKVAAFNESVQKGVDGKGPTVMFESLARGRMLPAGAAGGANGVFYHGSSPASVETAQTVAADAKVAVGVYNALVKAYPEDFPGGPLEFVDLVETKTEATPETVTEEVTPETTQEVEATVVETAPDVETEVPNTTAVDETTEAVETPVETVEAVEETATDLVKFVKDKLTDILTNGFAFTFEKTGVSLAGTIRSKKTVNLNLEAIQADFDAGMTYLDGVQGVTSEQKQIVFSNIDVEAFKAFIKEKGVEAYVEFIAAHEARHIVQLEDLGQVYPSDLLAHQAIAMERDANQAGFDAIGFVPEVKAPTFENLDPRFNDTYSLNGVETEYTDGNSVLDMVDTEENAVYTGFARKLMNTLIDGVNARLPLITVPNAYGGKSVKDSVLSDLDIFGAMRYKATALMDTTTGVYDQTLVSLAAVAVVDWVSGVRSADPHKLDDTLEDLGVSYRDLTKAQLTSIANGVPPQQAAEAIAKDVMKLWNMTVNKDAPMIDSRGIVEGIVKELITVLAAETDFVTIEDVPTVIDGVARVAQTLNVKGTEEIQKSMGMLQMNAVQKLLAPELNSMPSIGEKIKTVATTQSRGDVDLSEMETKALKNMQDTPHTMAQGITALAEALGFEFLAPMLGWKNMEDFKGNKTLQRSVEGKNISIERDFADAFQLVDAIRDTNEDADTEVFYRASISKVGRHQFMGINPQNNKILRALVTATHAVLDMTTKDDSDAFWLTIAQGMDVSSLKVENVPHDIILRKVEAEFTKKYGAAADLALDFIKNGEIDGAAFAAAMGEASMAQINTVFAVAQLNFAKETGTLNNFNTSISFELDGKTDGPGNMMVNFGQGILTMSDMNNLEKVGYFLGQTKKTLNEYFGAGNQDLYDTTSRTAERLFSNQILSTKDGAAKTALQASQRFASVFGDFAIDKDTGEITMTRKTAKNPMTKTVYGSGVSGVAGGVAQAMELEFYRFLASLAEGAYLDSNYPTLEQDVQILFGVKLPDEFNGAEFEFTKDQSEHFAKLIEDGIGGILSEAAKKTIGDPITEVNATLVMISNIQSEYLRAEFDARLIALAEEQAVAGKIGRSKAGKPIISQISQRDYDNLVKELSKYAPMYSNGHQSLAVGSFSKQSENDGIRMSSNFDEKLRQPSNMMRPDAAGVKVIPYISIGRGDAMMMNRIYSADNAPTNTLPVFDGIDMPVNMVKVYADQINEAVQTGWDTDVLIDILNDFESFLRNVGPNDKALNLVFGEALKKVPKNVNKATGAETSVITAKNVGELLDSLREMHMLNLARKKAFKLIARSVDHMGGSGQSFSSGVDGTPLSLSEINLVIEQELRKLRKAEPVLKESEEYTILQTHMNASAVVGAILRGDNPTLAKTVRAIASKLPANLKIITGSLEQLNAHRIENYPDDGQILTGAGNYDTANNVLFIAKNSNETMVHELVHAATHQQTLEHFDGTKPDDAVARLNGLMIEFQSMNFSKESAAVQADINKTLAAIIKNQADTTPESQAAALNEFMAWSLTNENVAKTLKTTRTSAVKLLTKKVKALFKRMMNGVPEDMFSSILFNTQLLQGVPVPPQNGNGISGVINNNQNGQLTPQAHNQTNFWMDLVSEKVAAVKSNTVPTVAEAQKLVAYEIAADSALAELEQGGFTMDEYQKNTFRAIHMVMATEMRLDPQSLLAMNAAYQHIIDNLSPAMFGTGQLAQEQFSSVMAVLTDVTAQNQEGVSDSIGALLALSQTSEQFRNAIAMLPVPAGQEAGTSALNTFLSARTAWMFRKFVGTTDISGKELNPIMDVLAKNLIRLESDKDYGLVRAVMSSVTTADKFTSGMMSRLANVSGESNANLAANRGKTVRFLSGSVAFATSFLDVKRSKKTLEESKKLMHLGMDWTWAVPINEFVTEVVGTDKNNAKAMSLLNRVNHAVSSMRQAYRESLPKIFQDAFTETPEATQWKAMHSVFGKGDFAAIFSVRNSAESFRLVTDTAFLNRKINDGVQAINKNFTKQEAKDVLEKIEQLADAMNDKGAGHQLLANAYAINKLAGPSNLKMEGAINALVSLYALRGADISQKTQVGKLIKSDPEAVKNMVVYMKALNKAEDEKDGVSESARFNGMKGFIPDTTAANTRLEIREDSEGEQMKKMGFTRVGDFTGEAGLSTVKRGYYTTTVKQGGAYSQGALQQVQGSYRGVDKITGYPTSEGYGGVLSTDSEGHITDELSKISSLADAKEALRPLFNNAGKVETYVRVINPDMVEKYLGQKSHLGQNIGIWAGRQIEEKQATVFNAELIGILHETYENAAYVDRKLFVNLAAKTEKDPILRDSWNVISTETKAQIAAQFGEGEFWVRRDQINLAVGYRDPSIVDVWTGKTRMPAAVQTTIKAASTLMMGKRAMVVLSRSEQVAQTSVSFAKDLIVVRSLVVPAANLQANALQLTTRGVGTKDLTTGFKAKWAEVDQHNKNVTERINLEAQIQFAGNDKNKVRILEAKIKAIDDLDARMSIAPMIAAGAYKNISEGITDMDTELTGGRMLEWIEKKVDRLPNIAQSATKNMLMSKDTQLYQMSNKAVQYGDFLAKSIYYDHLVDRLGLTPEDAMSKVNEEFVNFSVLPGRMRTYSETIGASWFMSFKIRIAKIALSIAQENPTRAVMTSFGAGYVGLGSPIGDNLGTVILQDRLDYSLGWDMLWGSAEMNPWMQAVDWANG